MLYITYIMTVVVLLNGEPESLNIPMPDLDTCVSEAIEFAEKAREQRLAFAIACVSTGENV